jgi:hypothetical protein
VILCLRRASVRTLSSGFCAASSSHGPLAKGVSGRLLCSGCRRWCPAGVLTLTGTKRPLGPATDAVSNGRCSRCSGRRPTARRLAVPTTAPSRVELVLPTQSRPRPARIACRLAVVRRAAELLGIARSAGPGKLRFRSAEARSDLMPLAFTSATHSILSSPHRGSSRRRCSAGTSRVWSVTPAACAIEPRSSASSPRTGASSKPTQRCKRRQHGSDTRLYRGSLFRAATPVRS